MLYFSSYITLEKYLARLIVAWCYDVLGEREILWETFLSDGESSYRVLLIDSPIPDDWIQDRQNEFPLSTEKKAPLSPRSASRLSPVDPPNSSLAVNIPQHQPPAHGKFPVTYSQPVLFAFCVLFSWRCLIDSSQLLEL